MRRDEVVGRKHGRLVLVSIGEEDRIVAILLRVLAEPGLGIELNEEVALAHPYTGDRLHLEMTNHPVNV